jgi:type IV pilus assembly protein PilB
MAKLESIVNVSSECTSLIPKKYIIQNRIVPIGLSDTEITVAISEPSALRSINGAKLISGKKVTANIVSQLEMAELLGFYRGEKSDINLNKIGSHHKFSITPDRKITPEDHDDITPSLEELSKTQTKATINTASLRGHKKTNTINAAALVDAVQAKDMPVETETVAHSNSTDEKKSSSSSKKSNLDKKYNTASHASGDQGSKVIAFVNDFIFEAVMLGASDIHIEPYKNSSALRFRIDGVLLEQKGMKDFLHSQYAAISTRIKIMAFLDIAERRLPQDGAIVTHLPDGRDIDLRVSVLPTVFGERIVMRILDRGGVSFDLDKLGIPAPQYKQLVVAVDASQGMVLVTGPTGSGKSTTLYGVLRRLNKPDVNILTAEDPVEFTLDGVGQVHVKDDIGLGFSEALRSFLRQDPEIILVGEIRDKETADIAIKAALTGHLVLSTLHANDAISTVVRLINMGIPGYLIGAALSLVVAQRLTRKICQNCKTKSKEDHSALLMEIGFSKEEAKDLKIFHGAGCDVCNGTGYKGRMGIYEVLRVDEELRSVIVEGGSATSLREIALRNGYKTMQEIGKDMIAEGILTLEEYQRNLIFN